MSDASVLFEIENGLAILTFNRSEVHNAFDESIIFRLNQIFDALALRDDIRVLLLRGAGKSFSAGADIEWMKRAASFTPEQNKADALALADMLYKLDRLPQVTIACVQGAAMGGGLGLLACCDIVIAREDSVFALSEVKMGLIPATIAPYVIKAIGARSARRFFQTAERFDGKQAYHIGLVHYLVQDSDALEEQLSSVLAGIRSNAPQAMRAAKKLVLDFEGLPVTAELMDEAAQRIALIRCTDEAREGLEAFLEKRKASWVEEI